MTLCIPSCRRFKSILIGCYRNLCNLTSARPSLVFVTLCHIWVQQFQSISLLLTSSVLFFFYSKQMSFPDFLRALRISVATILSTSFSSIRTTSCTSTHFPYCHSVFFQLIPATCVWSYCHLIPPQVCLFLVSLHPRSITYLLFVFFFWIGHLTCRLSFLSYNIGKLYSSSCWRIRRDHRFFMYFSNCFFVVI